jgi:hypothetical protein
MKRKELHSVRTASAKRVCDFNKFVIRLTIHEFYV